MSDARGNDTCVFNGLHAPAYSNIRKQANPSANYHIKQRQQPGGTEVLPLANQQPPLQGIADSKGQPAALRAGEHEASDISHPVVSCACCVSFGPALTCTSVKRVASTAMDASCSSTPTSTKFTWWIASILVSVII